MIEGDLVSVDYKVGMVMDMANRFYWQQGGGDGDRVYCDICFQYGVILNGQCYAGKLNDDVGLEIDIFKKASHLLH